MTRESYPKQGEIPPQTQIGSEPGLQSRMDPLPHSTSLPPPSETDSERPQLRPYRGSGKLDGKCVVVTGGDSGIGRSVAVLCAKEGADIAINYLETENDDAKETKKMVEAEGKRCLLVPADIRTEDACRGVIDRIIDEYGHIDVLVNNAAKQNFVESLEELASEDLVATFETNIFSFFYLTKHALKHMPHGSSIINSTSVTAYKGSRGLLDYSSTKGAIVSFTRSLAMNLAPKGIRVNAVAPGPVWTPLQPVSRTPEGIEGMGEKVPPLGRVAQPVEIAPSYVFLACSDGEMYTGQVLHPNGGYIVNG